MKKFIAAIVLAVICITCAVALTGCSASVAYELKYDEDGGKYYSVKATGYSIMLGGELIIPEYYGEEGADNYAPVKEIAYGGFMNCTVTKITIPATVTTIGAAAFAYNGYLREVVFADGSAVSEIPRGAFAYCTALKSIDIPETVESIGDVAYYNCTSLAEVGLHNGLVSIGEQAFYYCESLGSINLPETLVTIGALAFCSAGLTGVTIPSGVRDVYSTDGDGAETVTYGIGAGAFYMCVNLESAVVYAQAETLPSGTFGYCIALTEVYLPSSLKRIDGVMYASDGSVSLAHAFFNCTALTDAYYGGSEEEWKLVEIDNEAFSSNGVNYDNSAIIGAEKHYGYSY